MLETDATPEILGVLRVVPAAPPPRRAPSPAPLALLSGHVYPVSDAAVSLGRDLHNNAVLLDPAVSRYQALLERGAAEWTIANLSAQQPIGIDSLPLAPGQAAALAPGATLQLGATYLEWLTPRAPSQLDDTPGDRASEAPARQAAPPHMLTPGVTLQFAVRARIGRRAWWGLALAGLMLLLVGGDLTFVTVLLIGQQALGASGWGRIAAAVALPLVPTIAVALLVMLIDRYEREPFSLLLLAFLWGALIAIPIALFAERAVAAALSAPGAGNTLMQSITAGLLEEGVKGAGLILLLLIFRDQFDNVTDGIIYGLVIGAGFALVENYAYLALGPTSAFPGLILDRILLSWLGHSTFSALFGAGLGFWRERHARRGVWPTALIGFGVAAILHACFNAILLAGSSTATSTAQSPLSTLPILLGAYLPLFAAQVVLFRVLVAAQAREAEIRAHLPCRRGARRQGDARGVCDSAGCHDPPRGRASPAHGHRAARISSRSRAAPDHHRPRHPQLARRGWRSPQARRAPAGGRLPRAHRRIPQFAAPPSANDPLGNAPPTPQCSATCTTIVRVTCLHLPSRCLLNSVTLIVECCIVQCALNAHFATPCSVSAGEHFMTARPADVLRMVQEKGIRMVDFKFTDVPGTWQHFSVPARVLDETLFAEGIGFDGSSIRGFQDINESDMLLVPDPGTAVLDPFTAEPTLSLICDVTQPGARREAYSRDPRYIARKAEAYLRRLGHRRHRLLRSRGRVLRLRRRQIPLVAERAMGRGGQRRGPLELRSERQPPTSATACARRRATSRSRRTIRCKTCAPRWC